MDVHLTNLQQQHDANMLIWTTKPQRKVSNNLLNLCHDDLKQFWQQKEVHLSIRKSYLIKSPMIVFDIFVLTSGVTTELYV